MSKSFTLPILITCIALLAGCKSALFVKSKTSNSETKSSESPKPAEPELADEPITPVPDTKIDTELSLAAILNDNEAYTESTAAITGSCESGSEVVALVISGHPNADLFTVAASCSEIPADGSLKGVLSVSLKYLGSYLSGPANVTFTLQQTDAAGNQGPVKSFSANFAIDLKYQGSFARAGALVGEAAGYSVHSDDQTMAIGSTSVSQDGLTLDNSGAVDIYEKTDGEWDYKQTIRPSNQDVDDLFGYRVFVQGDFIAVTSINEASDGSSPADNSINDAGAVYVFEKISGTWTEVAYLKSSAPFGDGRFGISLAMDGNWLLVGEKWQGAQNKGYAHFYNHDGTSWSYHSTVLNSNNNDYDQFGGSVALLGNRAVISAHGEDSNDINNPTDNSAESTGAAFIFEFNGTNWLETAYLKASVFDVSDQFGFAVAIAPDLVAINGRNESSSGSDPADNSVSNSGAVYIFEFDGSNWNQSHLIKAPEIDIDDRFGTGIQLSGDYMLVSSLGEDSNGSSSENNEASNSGAAYLYKLGSGGIEFLKYIKSPTPIGGSGFTKSMCLTTDSILIGEFDAGTHGRVYEFK